MTQGADPEETQATVPATAATADADPPGRLSKKRRVLIYALIVVASLLILISVFATWAKVTLLDNETFVDTSAQFLANDTIRPALANFIANEVFSSVDVQSDLQNTLPENLKPLSAPLAAGLRQLAVRATNQVLASPRVQQAWKTATGLAQQEFVKVVEGNSEVVTQNGAVVTLDLKPILTQVAQQIGLSGNLIAKLPPDAGQLEILTQGRLEAVTTLVKVLKAVAFWFGIAGIAFWALAVYLARGRRRQTIRAISFGLLVVCLILVVFRNQIGNALVNALVPSDASRPAALAAWDVITQALHDSTIALLGLAVVGLLGSWVAGPGRWAVAVRRWIAPAMAHPILVYGVYGVVLLLVLIWGPGRSTRNIVTIVVLFGLATIGLEILRRQTIREFPTAEHGEWGIARGQGDGTRGLGGRAARRRGRGPGQLGLNPPRS